jgi:hypothetical protein
VRRGRQYRYYVSQSVLKGTAALEPGSDAGMIRRIAAAEIEGVVMAQVRALIRQPEIILGTWQAAKVETPDLTEDDVREALTQFEPMWDELFPGEQARIVQALVERVTVGPTGADIKLRVEGLAGLVRDLRPGAAWRDAA